MPIIFINIKKTKGSVTNNLGMMGEKYLQIGRPGFGISDMYVKSGVDRNDLLSNVLDFIDSLKNYDRAINLSFIYDKEINVMSTNLLAEPV